METNIFKDLEEYLSQTTSWVHESHNNETHLNKTFKGLSISGSTISDSYFKNVVFENCTFFGTTLNSTKFIGCEFINCKFQFSHATNCSFNDCNMETSEVLCSTFKSSEVLNTQTSAQISETFFGMMAA